MSCFRLLSDFLFPDEEFRGLALCTEISIRGTIHQMLPSCARFMIISVNIAGILSSAMLNVLIFLTMRLASQLYELGDLSYSAMCPYFLLHNAVHLISGFTNMTPSLATKMSRRRELARNLAAAKQAVEDANMYDADDEWCDGDGHELDWDIITWQEVRELEEAEDSERLWQWALMQESRGIYGRAKSLARALCLL